MKKRLNILFDEKWYENTHKARFLLRLIRDYEETITSNNMLGKLFWEQVLTNDVTAMSYWEFMTALAGIDKLSLERIRKVVLFLEIVIQENIKKYSKELFAEGKKAVYLSNARNATIAVVYAKWLVNQINKEDLPGSRRSCASKLGELSKTSDAFFGLVLEKGLWRIDHCAFGIKSCKVNVKTCGNRIIITPL